MPWTLYRYILRELLKLLVLTTAILVTVISFAAAIKPLADGLLGPTTLLKFVGFSAPTMLGFALPFAGAFASTLVFIRMAADNEIVACSASGMSYRSILTPVAILGLVLTMGLFFLSNLVIPKFYRAAAQTVESDLMTVLVSQLNQNRPFDQLDGAILYADHAEEQTPPVLPDSTIQPSKLIVLDGVAVGQLDDAGRIRSDATAERANVLLFRDSNLSWITIRLRNVMYYDPTRGQLGFTELYDVPPVRLPSPFRESPNFLSWPELRSLGQRPDQYHEIRSAKEQLQQSIAREKLRQVLRASFGNRKGEPTVLVGVRPNDRYLMTTPQLRTVEGMLVLEATDQQPVVVAYQSPNLPNRRFEAQRAVLTIERPSDDVDPSVHVELERVRVIDPELNGQWTERQRLVLPSMVWPEPVLDVNPARLNLWETLELAETPTYQKAPIVKAATQHLTRQVVDLARKIISELHERAASALACMMLLILGATLSMYLKGQMPLVVYFWSFLLAILTIILIHAGENMAGSSRFPLFVGLTVLWSGVIVLAAVAGWVYCRLARN